MKVDSLKVIPLLWKDSFSMCDISISYLKENNVILKSGLIVCLFPL